MSAEAGAPRSGDARQASAAGRRQRDLRFATPVKEAGA